MNRFTSFVVDDISHANSMLQEDLKELFPEMQIIGSASSVVEAAKKLQNVSPDILYLDIMLGDGTGFELLEILPTLKAKVIFVTASDEYAIKAFKYAAVDYLLKPYSINELKIATIKALQQLPLLKGQVDILSESLANKSATLSKKISLHTIDKVIVIDINSIIRCEADSNYTTFYLTDKSKIIVSKTLKYYSDLLKPYHFIRVHQSHLINSSFIKEFIKSDGGYLILTNHKLIPVSSRKKPYILEFLKKI